MSVKSDGWIRRMAKDHAMIEPFADSQVRQGVISYGVSSYGYDIRVGDQFKVFTNVHNTVVDPKQFDPKSFVDIKSVGKSTYARCGIIVNVTPFEPEWEGFVTLEISNTTPLPAKIYANEGIAQVLFFESDEICEISYADKKGKYQKQTSITLPRL
jgi:dCTP deaminase